MSMPLRMSLVCALSTLAVLAPSKPSSAAPGGPAVGGERLADRGLVVGAGAPVLPDVQASSWLVADLDTGAVLAAKDPHGRYAPASTLKTLTALTLIPVVEPTRRIVPTFGDTAVDGTKVGLVERLAYPAGELFTAMLMVSGNDAASALATSAGGDRRTAGLMNDRARELGALDTLAVNPHGLDAEGQVSSAYDLALITRAGLQDDAFTRYLTMRSSSVDGPGGRRIAMVSKNKLLKSYPGTIGGKNGFTETARASYVGAATRGDRRLVVAVMHSTPKVFDEAAKLLDWGFLATGAEPVGELVASDAPPPHPAELPTVPATRTLTPTTDAAAPVDGTGLPVTLGGMGLAAAAVFSVRRRPWARRRSRPARPRPVVARRG